MDNSATITKIEVQKKNKSRVSIFLDSEFVFGLDGVIAARHGLKEGARLTREQITNVLLQEEKKRVKEKAIRLLALRAHSEKELRTKLIQKGFAEEMVEDVISELKTQKLLDDIAFAHSYARTRLINKPVGERLLRQELRQKGISDECINAVVSEAFSEKDQIEYAKELLVKKLPRSQGLENLKKKKRLADFLVRRGFDWDLVKEAIEGTLKDES
jgi:regulatory protein